MIANSASIRASFDRASAPRDGGADEFDVQTSDYDDEPFTPAGDDEDDDPGSRASLADAEQALRKQMRLEPKPC
jgi:hypothetical protein